MSQLNAEQARDYIFGNYQRYIDVCKQKFSFLERQGSPCEDIVNESIINTLDIKKGVSSEKDLDAFIIKAIIDNGFREHKLLKDYNFTTKIHQKSQDEFNIVDIKTGRSTSYYDAAHERGYDDFNHPTDTFIRVYNAFNKARFGDEKEKQVCHSCGFSNKFYVFISDSGKDRFKCGSCGTVHSHTSKTWMDSSKMSFTKIYLLVLFCCKKELSSRKLGKRCFVTQKTAYYKQRLIKSIIAEKGSTKIDVVLERLFENRYDGVAIKDIGKNPDVLRVEDKHAIVTFYESGIWTIKQLASLYNRDKSGIARIIRDFGKRNSDILKLEKRQFILED